MVRRVALGCLTIFAVAALAMAQEGAAPTDEPTWLLLERGRFAFSNREYGEALRLYREAKAGNSTSPEIDIAIGEVFEAEGELDLALLQYEKALEYRNLLEVRDDELELLYRMAALHRLNNNLLNYKQHLELVVDRVQSRHEPPLFQIEEAIGRVLIRDGIDALLQLYRIEDLGAQRAYYELGRLLLYDGFRFIEASNMLVFSVIMTITEVASYILDVDPSFRFDKIEELLSSASRFRAVERYLLETQLLEQLYALGHALAAAGRPGPSDGLRNLINRIDSEGAVGRRAGRPYPEL